MHPAVEALITGLALSADAVAVAIAAGMCADAQRRGRQALALAATFGGFQALMPALGWFAARALEDRLAAWDHWIAAALLIVIGLKMAWEGLRAGDDDAPRSAASWFAWRALLGLGLATSIDAAAVGATMGLTGSPLLVPALIIGATTFTCCLPAALLGTHLAKLGGSRAPILGGVVLIGLGVRAGIAG
jgi:putative Mn2+ efflux pump MntP